MQAKVRKRSQSLDAGFTSIDENSSSNDLGGSMSSDRLRKLSVDSGELPPSRLAALREDTSKSDEDFSLTDDVGRKESLSTSRESDTPTQLSQDSMAQIETVPNIVLEPMDGGKWFTCKGGTFQMLAVWMATYNQDRRNLNSFLLCYRQFASPETLFAIVMALYGYALSDPAVPSLDEPLVEVVSPSKKERLGAFLCEWVEQYFAQDFLRKPIFQHLVAFTKVTKNLREDEAKRLKLLFIQKPRTGADSPWLNKPVKQIALADVKASALAEQLTFIDAKQFRSIKPEEFLDTAWSKKNKEDLAPNLLAFCHRFNQVSWWVATQIVEAADSKKQRALLVKFIATAERCHALGNYNSLMAILSGLNNFSIQRLKKAWMLPAKHKDMFDKLEILMEPKQNFKNYRKDVEKKAREENSFIIPYVAMYMRDITFAYDGNNDFLNDDKTLINFEKWKVVHDLIAEIKRHQKASSSLTTEQDPALSNYLLEVTYLDEETLHEKSLACEPPRGAMESQATNDTGEKEESIFGPDRTITKPPFSWTVANVQEWLESKDMGQYKELFAKKTINGAQALELNNRTLLALGITNLVHRKQMLKALQTLQSLDFNTYSSSKSDPWQKKPTKEWSTMDVCMWLESIELGEYKKVFLENQVAGAELLDLESDDLLAMNMTRLGHRKRLLLKKADLLLNKSKRNNSAPASKTPSSEYSDDDERSSSAPETKETNVKRRFSWDQASRRSEEDSDSGTSDVEEKVEKAKEKRKARKGKRSVSSGEKERDKEGGKEGGKEKRRRSSLIFGKSKSLVEEPEPYTPLSARDKIEPRSASLLSDDRSSDDSVSGSEVAIKCYFDTDIRVLHVEKDINLVKLKQRIIELYGLTVSTITVKYKDLEDDRITIRSEDDLKFAMLSIGMSSFMRIFVSV